MLQVFKLAIFVLALSVLPAMAFDWTQPITDEMGKPVDDLQLCPDQKPCGKILTIGMLTARALLTADPRAQETPDQKALAGNLGLEILKHPDMTPTPDQLKLARDAIGKLASPLAVARGWAILDAAVK
jgi:hypothetical protein